MAFETVNIGSSPKSATAGDRYTFSKVRLIDAKTGEVFEAGDDTGRTFVYKAPVGASDLLARELAAKLEGKMYTAYEASRASVDPAAEIGDCIEDSTGRLTGAMFTQTLNCGSGYSTCGAPGFEETEAEYPQKTELDKAISYTNGAIWDYAGGGDGDLSALRVEVVDSLPEGHEKQNVLWVLKYVEGSSTLRMISITGSFSRGTLSPSFKSDIHAYQFTLVSTEVLDGRYVFDLTITADDADAEIIVSGLAGESSTRGKGTYYNNSVELSHGMVITIKVEAVNSSGTYTITVI